LAQIAPAMPMLGVHRAFEIEGKTWGIWAIWWLAMAFFSKSTKRRESPMQRIEHLVPALLGFCLVFREGFGGQWLERVVIPEIPMLLLFCTVTTVLGLSFAVWARLTLGSNWSGTVTIKTGHQLIRRGPYRSIRHPIYTGMLAALLATAITRGLLSGFVGFAFVFLALYRKARRRSRFCRKSLAMGLRSTGSIPGCFCPGFREEQNG
jgi:protein-S-isoprenylcysteine O-methyltransferase Ste14